MTISGSYGPGLGRFAGYPFPIAAPHRLMQLEAQPSAAIQRLFDVVDLTLRFLGACLAAELAARGDVEAVRPWFDKPLSTGAVQGWIREVLADGRGQDPGPFRAALRAIHSSGRAPASALLDELIAARNRTRGHGITITEGQAKKLRQELEPKLHAALEALAPLEAFRTLIVKGINDFDGEWHEHQVLVASGDNPYFPVDVLRTRKPLPFGRVYLMAPDRSLLSLHPFVLHEDCPRCEEPHLFLLQSAHGGKLQHVDPMKGCVLKKSADVESLLASARDGEARQSAGQDESGTAALGPGSLVATRYDVERELGRGASGQVFAATDRVTGERVALKVLRLPHEAGPDSPATRRVVERFQREAQAVGRLRHPGIVQVLDVGVDRGVHYFTMEIVSGEELRKRLDKGRLGLDQALAVATQLLSALEVAHQAGIVHRDVKPENVILQADGTAKLTDFGVARIIDLHTITSEREVVGTLGYMAPEQVDGRRVDGRADVFAVGVVLHEMLTGRRPFEGETVSETVTAVLSSPTPSASSLVPSLPPWIDQALQRLMAKDAEKRPAGAHAALELLAARGRATTRRWRRARRGEKLDLEHVHPVSVRGLVMGFGRKLVLSDLDLDVSRGTRLAILGRNGAGKTTLLQGLLGMQRPRGGRIQLFGAADVARTELNAVVGYIPERPTAYPFMRLGRFLDHLASIQPRWDHAYAKELLRRFDLDPRDKIGSMSRGRQTMVSIVAAFGHRPPLMILDDPTLGLDAVWVDEFRSAVAELTAARGATLIFSTHDFDSVGVIADRVGFLLGGRVCSEVDVKELARRYCHVRLVLPDDEEPERLPDGFSVLERRKRMISGTYHVQHVRPEAAFAPLRPAEFVTSPSSLKDVYFHVLKRAGADG